MEDLSARLRSVRGRIGGACSRSGRDPASVRLVAITKTVPLTTIREAIAAGQDLFGENRVQEALPKLAAAGPSARWHFVGHLQTNKARQAVGAFELIHGVDSLPLADEIARRAAARGIVQPVLAQANLADEATKHGVREEALASLVEAIVARPELDLRGLMIIPPPEDDPERSRPWFRRLRSLRDELSGNVGRPLPELSMGMSDDFEIAIEEGATLVRVGRAIFGERA